MCVCCFSSNWVIILIKKSGSINTGCVLHLQENQPNKELTQVKFIINSIKKRKFLNCIT